jgi:hypothetical protein
MSRAPHCFGLEGIWVVGELHEAPQETELPIAEGPGTS